MFQTALLIVTRPVSLVRGQIPVYLADVHKFVSKTVYIHIQSENLITREPDTAYTYANKVVPYTADIRNLVKEFYSSGAAMCSKLDIRVLLDNVSNSKQTVGSYKLHNVCDLVLVDKSMSCLTRKEVLEAVSSCFSVTSEAVLRSVEFGEASQDQSKRPKLADMQEEPAIIQQVGHTVLGGTFDRLHAGHKLLLSEGCLLATGSLTAGVTEGNMNAKKTLCELIQPTSERIEALRDFLEDVKPSLEYKLIPITDMFGPSTVDPDLDLIVLSQETQRGGAKINAEREEKGLKTLQEYTIELIEDTCHTQFEEEKVSSSSLRKRLLGTLFHPVKAGVDFSQRPYMIGLTGGIASGKSAICKRLEGLGAASVDCDKLGHRAYLKGTTGFDKVVEAFGADVVGDDGEINRKSLGGKVFGNKDQLQKLNDIVWPEIAAMAETEIQLLSKAGHNVIVLEAAILLEAGWDSMVQEVWVTIIPSDEAVRRMIERNKLSEEQAKQRLASQISNTERVQRSNVIFSSLWEYEYTQSQVEKAWRLLQQRIGSTDSGKQTSNL